MNKQPNTKVDNWTFCNGDLKYNPDKGYCESDYKCDKCGSTSGLVNIIGLCSVKVFNNKNQN